MAERNPLSSFPFLKKPPIPPEHGAWAMLFVSLILGSWVARSLNGDMILAALGLTCLYMARFPMVLIAMRLKWLHLQHPEFIQERLAWFFFFLIAGLLFLGWPLTHVPIWIILVFALLGLSSFVFEFAVAAIQARKTAVSELVAAAAIALCAPFMMTLVTHQLDGKAMLLWLLLSLHFTTSMLYVRMRLRAMKRDLNLTTIALKIRFALPAFLMTALAISLVTFLFAIHLVSFWILLAFVIPLPRFFMGFATIGKILTMQDVKRIGWGEVCYSIVFLVMVGWRGL